jgi:hypothetical protein
MPEEQFFDQCIEILKKPNVRTWYNENMYGKDIAEMFDLLEKAISDRQLTPREALGLVAAQLCLGYNFWERVE